MTAPDPWLVYLALPTEGASWLAHCTETAGWLMEHAAERGLVVVPLSPASWAVADILYPRDPEQERAVRHALIERCDAVIRFPGAAAELDEDIRWAEDNGLPIFDADFLFLDFAARQEGL